MAAKKGLTAATAARSSRARKNRPGLQRVPATGTDATRQAVPAGFVRFWPPGHPDNAVTIPMGPRGFSVNREGGWEGITVPAGLAISAWRGMPAVTATVDIILERWETQESVQPAFELLLGQMNHGAKATTWPRPPAPVMVTPGAAGSKVIGPKDVDVLWVITAIDVDETATVVDDQDRFIRIEAVVSLMQHNVGRSLRDSAKTIRKVARATRPQPYTTKKGDTLLRIARHELQDTSRWDEIQKLNPKVEGENGRVTQDPRVKLKAGQKLKLP